MSKLELGENNGNTNESFRDYFMRVEKQSKLILSEKPANLVEDSSGSWQEVADWNQDMYYQILQ